MEIKKEYPPNINDITAKFPLTLNVVFTYGDTIYSPAGTELPKHLIVHEGIHSKQQLAMGVEAWWKCYLEIDGFRLDQELEAYANQFKEYCKNHKRQIIIYKFLSYLAEDLSSALYGNIISYKEAYKQIKSYEVK